MTQINRSILTSALLLLACMTLLGSPASAEPGEVQKTYQEAYEVQPGIELRVRHGDGNITVKPWDQDVVDVSIEYFGDFRRFPWHERADFEATFTLIESEIRVVASEKNLGILPKDFKLSDAYSYEITIQAPTYLALNFEGVRGDVTIDGWQGPIDLEHQSSDLFLRNLTSELVKVQTVDSDVRIEGLTGKINLKAVSSDVIVSGCNSGHVRVELEDGDISVRDCEGNFELQTTTGEIKAERVRARHIDVRTVDGDVSLDLLKTADQNINVTADDADVEVSIEHGTSIGFLVQSFRGPIYMRLPGAEGIEKDGNSVAGRIHGGAGHIRIGTDAGAIRLIEKPES